MDTISEDKDPEQVAVNQIYFAFIHGDAKSFMPAFLTKLFTKSECFHCGFVDLSDNTLIDMNLLPRKTNWPCYVKPCYATLYPVTSMFLNRSFLEYCLKYRSRTVYGFMDYLMFGFRWFYKLIGRPVPDSKGDICTAMVVNWANASGFYQIPSNKIYSPGELEEYIRDVLKLKAIRYEFPIKL